MKIYHSIEEIVGHTPLLQLENYSKNHEIGSVTLLAKLEYLNPAGSVRTVWPRR